MGWWASGVQDGFTRGGWCSLGAVVPQAARGCKAMPHRAQHPGCCSAMPHRAQHLCFARSVDVDDPERPGPHAPELRPLAAAATPSAVSPPSAAAPGPPSALLPRAAISRRSRISNSRFRALRSRATKYKNPGGDTNPQVSTVGRPVCVRLKGCPGYGAPRLWGEGTARTARQIARHSPHGGR